MHDAPQTNEPDTKPKGAAPDSEREQDAASEPRLDPALQAFLKQQRAAMGFT